MRGIRIRDLVEGKYLAFDLKEILVSLGPRCAESEWSCSVEQAISHDDNDAGLESSFNAEHRIHGARFMALAAQTRQIIDGVFEAFDPGAPTPWVRIEAIDSSFWEVYSEDPKVLALVSAAFRVVEAVREGAG